jgi:hypothetical protein
LSQGWKHFFHHPSQCSKVERSQRNTTLAIVLWKNVFDWVISGFGWVNGTNCCFSSDVRAHFFFVFVSSSSSSSFYFFVSP